MAWDNSTRRSRLPPDWKRRRLRVLRRDGYHCLHPGCTHHDPTGSTLEVDHIERGDDHSMSNLQTLCGQGSPANHHQAKTIRERRPPRTRPAQSHPGLL